MKCISGFGCSRSKIPQTCFRRIPQESQTLAGLENPGDLNIRMAWALLDISSLLQKAHQQGAISPQIIDAHANFFFALGSTETTFVSRL